MPVVTQFCYEKTDNLSANPPICSSPRLGETGIDILLFGEMLTFSLHYRMLFRRVLWEVIVLKSLTRSASFCLEKEKDKPSGLLVANINI